MPKTRTALYEMCIRDRSTATGDLYYLDGKDAVLVDENVSSIFDFYKVG